jgi:hypothetical protein
MLGLTPTVRFGSSPEQLNVELGRARAFMRGQGLGVFERVAGRDADRAEHVAAELDLKPASAVRGVERALAPGILTMTDIRLALQQRGRFG